MLVTIEKSACAQAYERNVTGQRPNVRSKNFKFYNYLFKTIQSPTNF